MEKNKILIVDDDIDNLIITSRILKKEGYEVLTVSSGFDCLKTIKTFKPDLILLDVLLPDINGYEVCRIIKSDIEHQDVIIIYYTSVNRSSEIKAEGYQKGADGYITRPISNTELLSIIKAYLKVLKKARELKRSEQRLNFLSDLSFEGLLIHDKKNIIDVNKKLLNIMGYNSIEELPNINSVVEFVAPDSQAYVEEKLKQNYEGTYVANLKRKDGSIFPAEINAKNITINGQLARAVSVRDITERFVLEREVKLALEKAIEASKMKSQFIANVSHEIRTPINSILTIVELLKETPLTKEQTDYIEWTKKSAESLLHLIDDILDISKIEAGKLEIENIDFDIHELIEDVFKMVSSQIKMKGLEMRLIKDEQIPQYLNGDPSRLKQVLINLINNAIKFTEKGFISLTVKRQSDQSDGKVTILFIVTDSGKGISQENQEKIFESFTQEDGSISRKYGGTGLGLAISQSLVSLMGGNIWVESEVGEGSSFYFTIPFNVPQNSKKTEDKSHPTEFSKELKDIKILLAEDNQINQVLTMKMLQRHDFIVKPVSNGIEVLEELSRNDDYDVVLMDIQMPEKDGLETTEIIRGYKKDDRWAIKRRDIPIIALTANAMKEDRELCIASGMDDYIAKPINFSSLFAILKRVLYMKKNYEKGDKGLSNLAKEEDRKPMPSSLINRDKALELLGGDEEMLDQVYDMFVSYAPTQIETLNKALLDKDLEVLNRVSHSLKSNAGTIGCDILRQKAYEMEMSAKQGDLKTFEDNFADFISLIERVIKEIGSMKKAN